MDAVINGVNIKYEYIPQGGKTVVLLHGWGSNRRVYDSVARVLSSNGYGVVTIDLAGFGESSPPDGTWGIEDYSKSVLSLLELLRLDSYYIVGHSFGGRIAIYIAAHLAIGLDCNRARLQGIVLVDSAGLRPRRKLIYYLKVWKYKLCKKLHLDTSKGGSSDYKSLPDSMKSTFVRVVNEHLDRLLPEIELPTLIVWGRGDTETPLYMAKKLHKKIASSELVVLDNVGHYSFVESHIHFCKHLVDFLQKKY